MRKIEANVNWDSHSLTLLNTYGCLKSLNFNVVVSVCVWNFVAGSRVFDSLTIDNGGNRAHFDIDILYILLSFNLQLKNITEIVRMM